MTILLPLLYYMEKGIHNLMGIVLDEDDYKHLYWFNFPTSSKPAVYNETIPNNSTNVVQAKAESVHTANIAVYLLFATAERKTRDFILAVVEDTWVQELQEPITFYTFVSPPDLPAHLQTLYSGLHDLDVLSL